jgi:hypothetical protein
MKIFRMAPIVVAILVLSGCATTAEYSMYAEGQARIEAAKYAAEAARYNAMAKIAESGDPAAKVAAVMALALGNSTANQQTSAQLKAPEAPGDSALRWASILVPSLTQGYSIYSNTKLGMAQSNNSARVAISTNEAFLGMASQIQAPVVTTPQANVTNTTTTTTSTASNTSYSLSGTGVLGNGTYSTTANPTTTTSNTNTLSGSGVVGSGRNTPTTTSTSNTVGGSGVVGSGSNAPSTSTSTNTNTNNLSGTGTQGGGSYQPTPPVPAAP